MPCTSKQLLTLVYAYASGPCNPYASDPSSVFYNLTEHNELTSLRVGRALGELIKNMEVSLVLHLAYDTTFLEQIVCDLSTYWLSVVVEHDLEVFALRTVQNDERILKNSRT